MFKRWMIRLLIGVLPTMLAAAVAAAAEDYRVMLLGDVHYDAREYHPDYKVKSSFRRNLAMWEGASQRLLKAAGEQANKEKAAFVVQLGDITQGDADTPELQEKMFRTAFSILKQNFPGFKVLVVKGNHDVRDRNAKTDNAPAERALLPLVAAELGVPKLADGHYAFRQGRDLFIAVDGFAGGKKTVDFVRKSLADNSDARYVFLMTHLPVLPACALFPVWLVPGFEEIAAMLETRKALVLAAHTHRPSLTTRTTARGYLPQIVVSSMGCDWAPKKLIAPAFTDWEGYLAAAGKAKLKGRNRVVPKELPRIAALGAYTHRRDFVNSGFAVLDVSDEGVAARVFTDASGTPALTLRLIEGPAAVKTAK